jgi:hypothetical protein
MTLHVPVERSNDVAPGDAGIVEHARQPVEQRFPAEGLAGTSLRFGLFDDVRGNRRGE